MSPSLTLFFDGDCPLCAREIELLRRLDHRRAIEFLDIAAPGFDAAAHGLTQDALMAELTGRLPDGRIVTGMETIRQMYAAVGLGPLVAWTRWPGLRPVADAGYQLFARNRLRLTGRCTPERCELPPREPVLGA